MKILRELTQRFRDRRIEKELNEIIDASELETSRKLTPEVKRESHETYRLGSCTMTVMRSEGKGGKSELKNRLIQLEIESNKRQKELDAHAADVALNPTLAKPETNEQRKLREAETKWVGVNPKGEF